MTTKTKRPCRAETAAIPPPAETEIVLAVLDALRAFGVDIDRQNTGGLTDAKGQYVAFGKSGNSDLTGMLVAGPGRGRKVDCEVKTPGFDPTKPPGGEKGRARWARQLARLRQTNSGGGYGFWVTSVDQAVHVLRRINEGWWVVIDEAGWPFVTDEE